MAEGIRVIHVDDEPEFAEVTATYLERENEQFRVETATSAAAGLEGITDRTDCVISDYDMPGMDGISFLEAVRERYPDLPFILFTGKGSEAVASEAISAGVTDYLQKTSGTEQYELLCKRIENAVSRRRAQTNYRELLQKTPVGLTVHDPDSGVITDANQTFGNMLGYDPDELEGTHPGDLSPEGSPFDRETATRLIRKTVETGQQQFEWQDQTKAGDVVWVKVSSKRAIIDGHQRVLTVARDITEQKKREQELDRYANIVEASGDPVYTLDSEGRFTFVNKALVEMTGYDETQLLGQHFSSILLREDAERGGMVMRSMRDPDTGRRTTELTVVRPDGGRVPCEIKVSPLPYESDFRGIVGVIRDITDRKERERQVREQRQRLEQREQKLIRLRDYTQELMYTETPSETASIALRAVDEILGFDLGAVFSRSETQDGVLQLLEVLNRPRMEKMYGGLPAFLRDAQPGTHSALAWEVFETGESVFINDTAESERLARKSPFGSLIIHPIGRHGVVLLAETRMDAFTGTEELLLDLLATALETSLDRLEREDDLRRQRDELQRQNERLDEFVSVVSHDLRNPLNVASARLELASDDCDSDHLEGVAAAIERMSTLIEDLLTLAREGEPSSDLESVALADVAEACWETVATADATLVADTNSVVHADRSRLQQLLENLIRNAVEHAGPDVTITIGDSEDGFYVADDGPGIPDSEREKVFDTGYSTTDDNTGFGLNIVREIVAAHGWEISVTDSEDGGARFEISVE
jgi:PAS domain S-box-containing protein